MDAYVREEECITSQACCDRRDPAQDDHRESKQAVNEQQLWTGRDQYHELFLPSGHERYLKPIVFGDGMDYLECDLYYQTREAQANGGVLRRRRSSWVDSSTRNNCFAGKSIHADVVKPTFRQSCSTRKLQKSMIPNSSKRSCLLRRYSFTASPTDHLMDGAKQDVTVAPPFSRSQSVRDDGNPPRVTFQHHVEVQTIDPIQDIPCEVRRALWMSKKEMWQAIQEEAVRAWEEQRANQSAEFARLFPMEKDDEDARSDDSVFDCVNDVFEQEELEDEEEFMSGLL